MRFDYIERVDVGPNMFEEWEHPILSHYTGEVASIEMKVCEDGKLYARIDFVPNTASCYKYQVAFGEGTRYNVRRDHEIVCVTDALRFKIYEE